MSPIRVLEVAVLDLPSGKVTVAHELTKWSDQTFIQCRSNGCVFATAMHPVSDSGCLKLKRSWT